MVRKCSIVGCCNRNSREHRSKGISFHRFPSDKDLRRLWVTAVQSLDAMKDWHPGKSACVCSEHFEKDDIRYDRGFNLLKPSVIPSRFRLSHKVRNIINTKKTVADLRQMDSKYTAEDSNDGNLKKMADLQYGNSDETNSRDAPMMQKTYLRHSSFKQVTDFTCGDGEEAADSTHDISMEVTADFGCGNTRHTSSNSRLVTLNSTEQMQCDASSISNHIQPLVLSGSNLRIKSIDPIRLSGENFKIKTLQPMSPNQSIYRLSDGHILILSPRSLSSTAVSNVDVPIQAKDHRSKPDPDIYSMDCAVHVPFDAKAIDPGDKSSSPLPILPDSLSKNEATTVMAARKTFVLRKLNAREFLLQRNTDSTRTVHRSALGRTLRTYRDSKKSLVIRQAFQSFPSKQKKLARGRNGIVHWLHAKA